jgi:surfeit locus 1 family protein
MIKMLFTGRRLWATLLVILGALVMVRLGMWQLDRNAQRQAINERIDSRLAAPAAPLATAPSNPADLEYRRVAVRGVFDPSQEIVLRNRSLDGAPGVHVLTPLRLEGHDAAVLVDRGWLPMNLMKQEQRQAYPPPAGEVALEGVARLPQASGPQDPALRPGESRLDAWFHVDIPRIGQQAGYPLLPFYVELQPAPGDPQLPRPVAITDLGAGPHISYAVQWFAFAVILLVGYVAFTRQQLSRVTTKIPRHEA